MEFASRFNNIYVIDTNMFGFEHYQSAYIVKAKKYTNRHWCSDLTGDAPQWHP
jgi:hypothetical protein